MLRHIAFFAFILAPSLLGQYTTFQCQGSTYTVAEGINNVGLITGYFYGSTGGAQGFTAPASAPNSNCTAFTIAGATNVYPQAINSNGDISGYYVDAGFLYHGFLRTAAGAVTTIDFPSTSSNTVVFDINNVDTVILSSSTGVYFRKTDGTFPPVSFSHAVLLGKMGITDLGTTIAGTVGGTATPSCFIDSYPSGSSTTFQVGTNATYCFDINNSGVVAGTFVSSGTQFAFVRTAALSIVQLNGLASSSANGLNDNNQVVGSYSSGTNQVASFVWNYTAAPNPLSFFPLTPCRMVDTRSGQNKGGFFGPPSLSANAPRDFPLLSSGCQVPISVQAYSLNATVVPAGPLSFLSLYPSGQAFPNVSTLNAPDGSVLANAALVPAGTNGSVTAYASQMTDLILDVNGYFAPPTTGELVFYPVAPCRVVDTRPSQNKTGLFGPPAIGALAARNFPISSDSCNIPLAAQAYSLNITAVPTGRLDFLSVWPAGQNYPNVSTLNSPDGSVIANAAIVPAGTGGNITVLPSQLTDLIIDVNGYFASPGAGSGTALHFYPVSPCRVADTRTGQGKTGAFGPGSLMAFVGRDFPIPQSGCNIPNTAQAYALNVTAVPQGHLDFLSVYPAGTAFPGVSTLNSPKGTVIANMAIVPAGTNGAVTVAAGNPTDVILDISGYFAP